MKYYIPTGFLHPLTKQWRKPLSLFNPTLLTLLLFSFIFSTKAIGQSADLDQGENGNATSPKPIFWQNGNLGPSGAHFAEGYSIPYRMRLASLTGGPGASHELVIEWDTKDQNGHALDYITHYDNLDNPSGSHPANFHHPKEVVNPTLGTAFTSATPSTFQIPTPSSTGAEVSGMPGQSFTDLPGASRTGFADATKMTIWGGTITALTYISQNNQDATTASTKTSLKITFTSANGTTALIAWGGHIAAEYDWGVGRGASKVSGSPYHMRLISIDGKGGNQDRSLKASAVLVPTVGCTISPTQASACEASTAGLVYSAGSQSGVTNYSWTLDPGTTNAKISGTAAGVNTVSGATVTSVTVVPTSGGFTTGTFSLSLTLTNLGGTGTPCTATGTINPAATANAGGPYTMCTSDGSVQVTGTYGGGATGGTWSAPAGTGSFSGEATNTTTKKVTATFTPVAGVTSPVTLTFTANDPDGTGPCASVAATAQLTINPAATANAGGPYTMCTSDGSVQVTGTYGGGATGGTWSAPAGTGSFSGEATNTTTKKVTATFTPVAGVTSPVTLTFTANDPDGTGPCASVAATAQLTINPAATANAGGPYTMCTSDGSVQVTGTYGGGATGGTWSAPAGTGSFSGEATNTTTKKVTATFTPVAGVTSPVTLTFTANDPDGTGPCASVAATAQLTINPAATANAGGPYTMCTSDGSVQVTGTYGGGATGGTWSAPAGTGSFSGEATNTTTKKVTATFTPVAGVTSPVTLTFTANDPDGTGPCASVAATASLTITANPVRPTVTYQGPECNQTTFGVTVVGAVTGGTYTLTQVAGVGTVVKTTAADKNADGNIVFSELTIGKGFSIVVKVGNCTSNPTDCNNYKTAVTANATSNSGARQSAITQEIELAPQPNVTATPNPFSTQVKFSLKSHLSGRGTLELYNLLGQKVKTVYDGYVEAGQVKNIEYNAPGTQSANLLYVFKVGDQKVTGKLIKLK